MPSLPRNLSGSDVIKALSKAGFTARRQKGSHVVMAKESGGKKVGCVVPLHKELKIGTLKAVLRQAEMTEEDFLRLL